MAFRKRRRTKKRSAPYKLRRRFKRRFKRGPAVVRNKGLIIADRAIVHLKYIDHSNFVPSSYQGQREYRLNSLFDPNYTGTGDQPVGFDQWTTFYANYRVFAASYRVRFFNNIASQVMCVTVPTNIQPTTFTTLQEALEQRYAKSADASVQTKGGVVTGKVFLPRLLGQTPAQYKASNDTEASTGANPVQTLDLILYFGSADGSSAVEVNYIIEIWYHAEMWGRRMLDVS